MTTDTRIKLAARTVMIGGCEVTLSAIAKGSGMIAPQLATALAVITTDVAISPTILDAALHAAMATSFNSLVIDGDTSTNDAILVLANGLAGNRPITDPGADRDAFAAALTALCEDLARDIAADGEGATKQLEVVVTGAPSAEIARDLARSVVGSSLVKAAVFGADPNWGRVLATIGARGGSQGYPIDPHAARVAIQGIDVFAGGGPGTFEPSVLKARMRQPHVKIAVVLGEGGPGEATAWGCDLSYDYVKINADYTSLIVQSADGQLAKDDRLTNYSPKLKRSLLVEALSYISQFAGKRCVIKYGGAAMLKDSLKKSFCDDIKLLRSVGLLPIVVHGGGPELARTLERLGGSKPEFIDGVQVTSESDVKVVEMVQGGVNSELVTLLNMDGAHAMGLSGKDGALLRVRKLVAEHGRDLGQVGEITSVNADVLEMLLGRGFVPVISPIGLGDDGRSYDVNADAVAAEIAIAAKADKLIYLTNVAGVLGNDELLQQLAAADVERLVAAGSITGGMRGKAESALKALAAGIARVHVIDGRTPHSVIAELFTDRGVGTLITQVPVGAPAGP